MHSHSSVHLQLTNNTYLHHIQSFRRINQHTVQYIQHSSAFPRSLWAQSTKQPVQSVCVGKLSTICVVSFDDCSCTKQQNHVVLPFLICNFILGFMKLNLIINNLGRILCKNCTMTLTEYAIILYYSEYCNLYCCLGYAFSIYFILTFTFILWRDKIFNFYYCLVLSYNDCGSILTIKHKFFE